MSEPPVPARRSLRFGPYELDVRSRELRRAGTRVNLPDQPLAFLTTLLERPGEIVTRDELRQRLWPGGTFVDFEHGLNAAVKRLRDALGDSADAPQFIETVPRRGYRFIAPVEEIGAAAVPPTAVAPPVASEPAPPASPVTITRTDPRLRLGAMGATALLVAGGIAAWLLRSDRPGSPPAMRAVRLSAMNGSELGATFSPDGRQVAFQWDGERRDNWDIYVKLLDSSQVLRLTTDAAPDVAPQWSPDGQQIAYIHLDPSSGTQRIRVVSPLGGADRKVSDFPAFLPARWFPDGRSFVVAAAGPPQSAGLAAGIYLLPADGRRPRRVTQPAAPRVHQAPAVSPDARRLAYASCEEPVRRSSCHVEIVELDPAAPARAPRRLTPHLLESVSGLTWSRDGRYVIYSAEDASLHYLWRVEVSGSQVPERIDIAGPNAVFPALSPANDRLGFSRYVQDTDIYRMEAKGGARAVAQSPSFDGSPEFSPDGKRIAFCSRRSNDRMDVWVADADGSAAVQLTQGPGKWQCAPAWSPDGHQIAFDSQGEDGSWHIWLTDTQGGIPRQVTNEAGDQNMPTWSRDGTSLYFSWKRGSERDIWRLELHGGKKQQVTRGGGLVGRESADGRTVFYLPEGRDGPLLAQPLSGGSPHALIPCVTGTAVAVTAGGVYYIPCVAPVRGHPEVVANAPVRVRDPDTGGDREVGTLEAYEYAYRTVYTLKANVSGFAVSPDGLVVLYSRMVNSGADLMMIDNFR
jgi:Tol biopolymer transport system component/DNA-binding winged helix-turn-helix (wHTH) protein